MFRVMLAATAGSAPFSDWATPCDVQCEVPNESIEPFASVQVLWSFSREHQWQQTGREPRCECLVRPPLASAHLYPPLASAHLYSKMQHSSTPVVPSNPPRGTCPPSSAPWFPVPTLPSWILHRPPFFLRPMSSFSPWQASFGDVKSKIQS